MTRARINYWLNMTALASALLVFPTGLILLARFHIGPDGAQRMFALGLSRAVWIDLHRTAAVAMTIALAAHAQQHWRAIRARVRRGLAEWPNLALYLGFSAVTPAAFAAWLALPLHWRHPAIDLHNFFGVILLAAAVPHVRRHLRTLIR